MKSFFPRLGFDASKKGSAVLAEHEFHVVEWKHPRLSNMRLSSTREKKHKLESVPAPPLANVLRAQRLLSELFLPL
jgi:hypothetical protein